MGKIEIEWEAPRSPEEVKIQEVRTWGEGTLQSLRERSALLGDKESPATKARILDLTGRILKRGQ